MFSKVFIFGIQIILLPFAFDHVTYLKQLPFSNPFKSVVLIMIATMHLKSFVSDHLRATTFHEIQIKTLLRDRYLVSQISNYLVRHCLASKISSTEPFDSWWAFTRENKSPWRQSSPLQILLQSFSIARINTKTYGHRSVLYSAATAWNSLSDNGRALTSMNAFEDVIRKISFCNLR